MADTVAFIGLGVMGFPMAGHLAAAGHNVRVYNRREAVRESWVAAHKGLAFSTPAAAAEGAVFVFMCVGNDDDVREVALGEAGVLQGMAPGSDALELIGSKEISEAFATCLITSEPAELNIY